MKNWVFALSALTLVGCGDSKQPASTTPDAQTPGGEVQPDAEGPVGDILVELNAIPGLKATEATSQTDGYRFFLLEYEQPVDHKNPSSAKFKQRMTFLFRDYAAPVVVYNSGYNVSTRGFRSQIAGLVNGNQLSMEYRYFLPSRPDPADWSKLDIEQAATDQHRITQALKTRLFKGKWLTTGASKGGMTSLFHRRFFPADVDGTIALVAPFDYPEDAVQSPTNRYIQFIENVGTDPTCRQKLKDFQNDALVRRTAMQTRMEPLATYNILGEDKALEFAVEELPFIFWQYGSQANCTKIPATTATDDVVFKFLDDTIDIAGYGDDGIMSFLPYYHQSASQLGYPISDESYLNNLMYPGADTAEAYLPTDVPKPTYDNGAAMHDVQDWIASSGSQIMLIYGQNDPWSAGAVDLGNATDSFKYISPNGNHGSSIATLATAEKSAAAATVLRWAGMSGMARSLPHHEVFAEEIELQHRPRL
jgi:hypothetical protein